MKTKQKVEKNENNHAAVLKAFKLLNQNLPSVLNVAINILN